MMSDPIVPQEDIDKINKWNDTAVLAHPDMATARQVEAYTQAVTDMAGGGRGQGGGNAMGSAMNMMAMGMMQNMMGWTCSCGRKDNRGKFCQECGLPKPALDGWTCSCGHVNQGKFCQECGRKKPEGASLYRCDKCGWEPEDPTKPPKFCPECGDAFDEKDRI